MKKRAYKFGELLAIDPKIVQQGPEGFFWMLGPGIKENSTEDGIACIYVHGPLEHHDDGCSDNYDSILCRAREAFADDEVQAVVLSIDSPGGVVSGLNETVASLRRMRAESGKPFIAFVDEMATSAAYALACSCDEIVIPKSGICGSIGVISTMADQVAYDQKVGFNFVTITSGARKADGHPHVPISDAAVSAETGRVLKLAKQFYGVVNRARGLSPKEIQGFQAGIYLGSEAVQRGLADGVMGRDELFEILTDTISLASVTDGGSILTQRVSSDSPLKNRANQARRTSPQEQSMSLTLAALIKKTEAELAKAKDAKIRKALALSLEAYKKTKHTIEKHESEEGGEEDEEEEEEKGNDTDRKEMDDGDEGDHKDEGDDEDDDEEDDEEEAAAAPMKKSASASAMLGSLRQMTGKKSATAVLGAVNSAFAKALEFDRVAQDVKALKAKERNRELDILVAEGSRKGQFPNPKFAGALKAQGMRAVKAYLEATKPGTFLSTAEAKHVAPDGRISQPGAVTQAELEAIPLSEEMQKAAAAAHAANPRVPLEKFLENMRRGEHARTMNGKGTY